MRHYMPVTREVYHLCDACESPHVIVWVYSKAGRVELCWDCAKNRLPGYELELHMAEMSNHLQDKIDAQLVKDGILKEKPI